MLCVALGAVLGLVGRARATAVAAAGIFSFARAHMTDEGVRGRRPVGGSEGSAVPGRATLRQTKRKLRSPISGCGTADLNTSILDTSAY